MAGIPASYASAHAVGGSRPVRSSTRRCTRRCSTEPRPSRTRPAGSSAKGKGSFGRTVGSAHFRPGAGVAHLPARRGAAVFQEPGRDSVELAHRGRSSSAVRFIRLAPDTAPSGYRGVRLSAASPGRRGARPPVGARPRHGASARTRRGAIEQPEGVGPSDQTCPINNPTGLLVRAGG